MSFHSCKLTLLTQVIIALCCVPLSVGTTLRVTRFLVNIYKIQVSVSDVHEAVIALHSGLAQQ